MLRFIKYHLLILLLLSTSCSTTSTNNSTKLNFLKEPKNDWHTDHPPSIKEISDSVKDNKAGEKLEGMKNWWLFGPGMGRTILNIGTTIIFPPYAIYLLTNAGLSLSGREPIKPLEALPEGPKEVIGEAYDGITSVPGRINALIQGEDYRN